MKLAIAVIATVGTTSSIVAEAAGCVTSHFSRIRCQLSTYGYGEGEYEMIAGYMPGTQVRVTMYHLCWVRAQNYSYYHVIII